MKIIGVIMEINPFHNGHKYFLSQIPKGEDDIIIAIISTTIMQRGEFGVLNKHDKAKILLNNNVDVVIELPGIYSNQGGLHFAKHSLNHLKALGVNTLYFGSESNDIEKLISLSKKEIENNFKSGIHVDALSDLKSNDILGISYLKNIGNIKPFLIPRIGNNYNDTNESIGSIQSATTIRTLLRDGKSIKNYISPTDVFEYINVDQKLLYKIFLTNLDIVRDKKMKIFLSEGGQLISKINKIITKNTFSNIDDLAEFASDKNNSKYKIKRVILNIILMLEDDDVTDSITYFHMLGFNQKGSSYVSNLKNLNVVTSLKSEDCSNSKFEVRISNLFNLLSGQDCKQDFLPPIIK